MKGSAPAGVHENGGEIFDFTLVDEEDGSPRRSRRNRWNERSSRAKVVAVARRSERLQMIEHLPGEEGVDGSIGQTAYCAGFQALCTNSSRLPSKSATLAA